MKKLLACLLFALVGSIAVSAQTTVSQEYKDEVAKVLYATSTKTILETTIDQMLQNIPQLPITDKAAAAKGVVNDLWPELLNIYTAAYSKYLSLDELRALTAFYATPQGKKIAEALVLIYEECGKAVSALHPQVLNSLMKYVDK